MSVPMKTALNINTAVGADEPEESLTRQTEFDEWAKRFEAWVYGQEPNAQTMPATCIYPIKEGPPHEGLWERCAIAKS